MYDRYTKSISTTLLLLAVGGVAARGAVAAEPATAPVQAEAAAPSAEVAEALRKFAVRAKIAGATPSAAVAADLKVRFLAIDDLIEAESDAGAILAAGKAAGLIPAAAVDYAAAIAELRSGPAKLEAAKAEAKPTAETKPSAETKPAAAAKPAEAPAEMATGCKARLFVLPSGTEWPPKNIPATPIATVSLPGLSDVNPSWVMRKGTEVPNHLVEHDALDGIRFYAVEYSGWIYAKNDGVYGISVESDDPYQLFIEGQPVLASDWSININEWCFTIRALNLVQPLDKATNTTFGTTPQLLAGHYYSVRLVSSQRWHHSGKIDEKLPWAIDDKWSSYPTAIGMSPDNRDRCRALVAGYSGAFLKVRVTPPDSEPIPLRLYVPAVKRVRRDE